MSRTEFHSILMLYSKYTVCYLFVIRFVSTLIQSPWCHYLCQSQSSPSQINQTYTQFHNHEYSQEHPGLVNSVNWSAHSTECCGKVSSFKKWMDPRKNTIECAITQSIRNASPQPNHHIVDFSLLLRVAGKHKKKTHIYTLSRMYIRSHLRVDLVVYAESVRLNKSDLVIVKTLREIRSPQTLSVEWEYLWPWKKKCYFVWVCCLLSVKTNWHCSHAKWVSFKSKQRRRSTRIRWSCWVGSPLNSDGKWSVSHQ